MQLEDDPCSRLARGVEGARAEERLHVVHVHRGRAELVDCARHLLRPLAAADERAPRSSCADCPRIALQRAAGDPGALERLQLQLDRAFLPAPRAVAVV